MSELVVFNADEFKRALDQTEPGDKILYWVGFLAETLDKIDNKTAPVIALQKAVLDAWYEGRVHLLQRKLGFNNYQYFAVRCHAGRRERPEGDGRWRSKHRANRREREKARRAAAAGMEVAV